MDLRMPGLDGIEATRQLLSAAPEVGVVVLTMFEDDESVFAAMRAGARGYLLKGAEQDEILRAVRAIGAGEAIFGPSVARRVIEHFAHGGGPARAAVRNHVSNTSESCRSPTGRRPSSKPATPASAPHRGGSEH